jgi:hypothetical protein
VAPTGTVRFYLNGAADPIAAVPLDSAGDASFSTSGLGAGANSIVGIYSGDGNFLDSTSAAARTRVGGSSCTITGHYARTVLVGAGQTVTICDATVTGGIVVRAGGSLDVEASQITGSVTANQSGPVRICGSSVGGVVNVRAARSWVLIGDRVDGCAPNSIAGSLIVEHNHHGVQVIGNTVVGGVIAIDNMGSGPFPQDTGVQVTANHR